MRKALRARSQGRLSHDFFQGSTRSLARALLGQSLVSYRGGRLVAGMIVETEAYLGSNDPACHAARGMTPRNEVMFRSSGHCYVYLIYGMYHCVNVVSESEGVGSAVLIRAVEPLEGIDVMNVRRGPHVRRALDLARGPGRLCEAFDIDRTLSGTHFCSSPEIWIEEAPSVRSRDIEITGRIGIREGAELPLRFAVRSSRFVSRA